MRKLVLSALILASAFQTALGQIVEGQWTYIIENGGATITRSTATGAVTIPSVLGGYAVKKVGGSIFGDENEKFSIIASVGSIVIPNSVSSIGDGAFVGCPNLASVTIPNSVTSIGASAFSRCTSLTNITIPNSVTSLGAYAFSGCWALTSITLGSSVENIGESTFSGCSSLSNITIPNSVTSIGDYAFYGCSSLTGTLTIPNSVTSIGAHAFQICNGLTTLTIGSGVTSIGDYAFSNCHGLTGTLTIPNSVTSIGFAAFESCPGLTILTIGSGVRSVGMYAFVGCSGLTGTLTIPNSVTSIGDYAFCNCSGLTGTLTIPNSVTSIGFGAFAGCSGLTTFTTPDKFMSQVAYFGINGQVATDYLVNALANNDAFVTAVANKIKATGGTYGIATQSGLSSAITTATEPLATKAQITTAINEGKASGIASVTASPNTWSLFTTSQIQNMAVGDLVLTKNVGGTFTLNYDIEQSTDLQTWTTYAPLSLPLTGLPTDKAFVRIKVRQDGVSNTSSSQTTPTTPTFGGLYNGSSGVSAPGGLNPPNYNGLPSGISPDWLNSLPTGPVGPIEEE